MENLVEYLEYIKADYSNWHRPKSDNDTIRDRMVAEFNDGVRYQEGSKYIKVIQGSSVHSFIMKKDDGKFKRGDILKAASWAAPARNFARGNLLTKNFSNVRWTGAL